MKIFIITFALLSILISCNYSQMSIEKEDKLMYWETLKIESRSQTIIINRYEEYGVRDTCDFEEVKINEFVIEYKPINRGQEYFNISQQEKDSLFKYIYDIVTNPIYTEQFATCYAGNISIGFSIGNTSQICRYNSVGNWTAISPSTERLYSLLKEKTKIPEF